MNDALWLDPAISTRLCLTLLHSLWLIPMLAVASWLAEKLGRVSVERSYVLHVAALVASLVALPITYANVVVAPESDSSVSRSAAVGPVTVTAVASPPNAAAPQPPLTRVERASQASSAPAVPSVPALAAEVSDPQPTFDWQRATAWILGVYALGVCAMLLRLGRGLRCARRDISRAKRLPDGPLVERLSELARQCSLRIVPVLATAEQIVVPQVVGLVRPMILLPASAVSGLSPGELRMVLAHELAHIRRHDLWVNLLQRLAETVLFFNPGLWWLTRRISTVREFCCDEFACRVLSPGAPRPHSDYAAALLRVAELSRPLSGAATELATLAAAGRSPSELRHRIARLLGEPIREPLRLSPGGLGVVMFAIVFLLLGPSIWPALTDDFVNNSTAVATQTDDRPQFELHVVDIKEQPVPHASVELRFSPHPVEADILVGDFDRPATYGTFVKTDDAGRLVFRRPESPERFNISIKTPGYGPYWAGWSSDQHPEAIPDEFTAELEAAWSVGGVIVDENGQPVEGVEVRPSVSFKKRPGDDEHLGVGTRIHTDADGHWRFDSVPMSMSAVGVEVSHPEYRPNRRPLTRDEFGLALDQQPSAKIKLDRGLTVRGRVTDQQGQPIEGALIRTKFMNDIRETHTDAGGDYALAGCEAKMARIVVSATGRATDMQEVRVDEALEPVNFVMQPGGHVRIRVVDSDGQGIPRARIFLQEWRGRVDYFEFDFRDDYADENGVWEWNEAPLDEFKADIWRPDGMQLSRQPLVARAEEYVFSPPTALTVSGRVIDAQTKQPVPKFRVIPGLRNIGNPSIRFSWQTSEAYDATDGAYRIRLMGDYTAHLVRIEADGYEVAVSRDIKSDEGDIAIDFELQSAPDFAATIVTPDGQSARGAKVALGGAGTQISLNNGIIDEGSTYATQFDADAWGNIRFPQRTEPFHLVITHPEGFAWFKADEHIPQVIRLTPWARVEGVFRVGPQTAPDVTLWLGTLALYSYGPDVPSVFTNYKVTTGPNGHYAFDRVVPGQAVIGRDIFVIYGEGAQEVTSSIRVNADLVAGQTTTLNLGGNGRAVTGRFTPPTDFKDRVLWNFALVTSHADVGEPARPQLPDDVKDDQQQLATWWEEWSATPKGQAWRKEQAAYQERLRGALYMSATVDRDGSFRIDDVPPGKYVLDMRFSQHAAGHLPEEVKFEVPPGDDLPNLPPLELGSLQLAPTESTEPRP